MQNPGSPAILASGQTDAGRFFHIILPQVEVGVTRLLAVTNNGAMLHEFDALGNVATQAVNLPVLRSILLAIDTLVTQ